MSVASAGPGDDSLIMCTRDWQRQAAVTQPSVVSTDASAAGLKPGAADESWRSRDGGLEQCRGADRKPRAVVRLQTVAE